MQAVDIKNIIKTVFIEYNYLLNHNGEQYATKTPKNLLPLKQTYV
ncbi:hypothetical protein BTHERMOSOX_992 [Bathymodiolus thermophilus thioautotrophic gill symbiont]|nr:hypothetical protein BTHERMOSOX_992 [Bathymodiolus thermophilus thioautotrophic gill symbiont]